MSIRRIHGIYLADTARVLGEVDLGSDVNIWFGVSIRGDVAPITIGAGTNVQDNAVIHADHNRANRIGKGVSIGHGAVVHGVRVGDQTLIGMHATVLGRAVIGSQCIVAAGAVVPPGMEIPDGMLAMGVPAKVVRPITDQEREHLLWLAPHYVQLAHDHATLTPTDPRIRPWGQT